MKGKTSRLMDFLRLFFATMKLKIVQSRFTTNTMAVSPAAWVIGTVLALYITAYTLPDAIVALTNQSAWAGAPQAVVTLGTTVLSIIVILALAIKFMPEEIKTKVGL